MYSTIGAITLEKRVAVISDECIKCGACVQTCPVGAISFKEQVK